MLPHSVRYAVLFSLFYLSSYLGVEIQAELDADMTVACLGPLHLQGLPESYLEVYPKIRRISTVPS